MVLYLRNGDKLLGILTPLHLLQSIPSHSYFEARIWTEPVSLEDCKQPETWLQLFIQMMFILLPIDRPGIIQKLVAYNCPVYIFIKNESPLGHIVIYIYNHKRNKT